MESKNKQTKTWVKYLSTTIALLVVSLVICLSRDLFTKTEPSEIIKILCDAFSVPGIVYVCFGLLSFCNQQGTFDGLGYTFKSWMRATKNYRNDEGSPKSYSEYKDSVKGKRKISWHFIIVGLFFIAVGIILSIIYAGM